MCFGGTKRAPDVPPATPPPEQTTEANSAKDLKAAQDKDAQKAKLAKGQSSTILTGPMGDTTQADVKKKTLLGS